MKTYPMVARIRNQAGGPTRIDVFDDIGDGGWSGGIGASDFTAQLAGISGPLDVHINSYGGSVADGTAIGNAIRGHNGPKRTIVDGFACSIASVIMQAGDERIVLPGSMVMIHDASSMVAGNAADMAKAAADLDKHSQNIAKQYAARAGGTPEQWREAMRAETWYDADEAVAAGLADKVGTGTAALPAGLDLAAFTTVPERIMNRLQTLPRRIVGAYKPQPYKREDWENVQCPVCGKYNDDDGVYCGQCGVMLAGRDDVTSERAPGDGDGDADDMAARAAAQPTAAAPASGSHGPFSGTHTHAHPAFGDQGGDTNHEHEHSHDGDADHHHTHASASAATDYLRRIAASEKFTGAEADAALKAFVAAGIPVEQVVDAVLNSDSVDQSDWDGPKAMSMAAKSDDPAATYKQICAGRRSGDPSKQDSWALPYKYPGKGPNAAGVRNALSRLPQTEGLTNKADAQSLLERLMKQINPDYDGGAHDRAPEWMTIQDAAPAWITETRPAAPAWLNHA